MQQNNTQNPPAPDVNAQLDQLLQQRLAAMGIAPQQQSFQQPAAGFAQPGGFNMQPAGAMGVPQCTGVMVPIELTGPDGSKVTLYLQYPASCAATPQAMFALVGGLIQQGYPVRTFAPRQNGWGGGGRGYRNGGGGYGGGGGWRQ